jgi:hypothetical protein
MNNINLDIKSYSIDELEKLLKLKTNYNIEDLNNAIINIRKKIISSESINSTKKNELEIFIDNINNKLINKLNSIDDKNYNTVSQYDENHFIIKNKNIGKSVLENNQKVNKTIIKKTYNIDSVFRQNYGAPDNPSNNFTINLPETVNQAVTMSISSIEIPLTYFNITTDYNNNCFHFELTTSNQIKIYKVELIPGQYRARKQGSLVDANAAFNFTKGVNDAIANSVNIQDKNDSITDHFSSITYAIEQHTGFSYFKIVQKPVNNISNIFINFDVDNRDPSYNLCVNNEWYQRLGWMMGYRNPRQELFSTTNDLSKNITNLSSAPCHINYPRYLYICIDDFQSNAKNYFSIASDSVIAPNIISRINILSLFESKGAFSTGAAPIDYRHDQKHIREYFGPTNIKKLKIKLIDEYGRTFSLNFMDWSFLLTFECYYN